MLRTFQMPLVKCVDNNWSIYLIICYFSLHQMESILLQTLLSSQTNEMMMQYTKVNKGAKIRNR